MNISTSESSESGWTMYLDQVTNSTDPYSRPAVKHQTGKGRLVSDVNHEDEDDGGLSMVSDATSGPPHFDENNAIDTPHYHYVSSVSEAKNKNKQESTKRNEAKKCLCLDDTASSPIFHFFKEGVAPSENHSSNLFSAAHFEGDFVPKNRLDFLQSSRRGKSTGCSLGRKKQ